MPLANPCYMHRISSDIASNL
ncbi:hypothetical protein YPPY58_3497, partial [Yersinia pestis PY-58]